MIVEMVAGEICEYTASEDKPTDAVLHHAVGTYFHEGITTTLIGHAPEQAIESDGIRRGMTCGDCFVVDIVADRGYESAFVAETTEEFVEKRCNGRFAVRASDADEVELFRRAPEERMCHRTDGSFAIVHHDISDTLGELCRQCLANYGCGPEFESFGDEGVAVDLRACHCHKHRARVHLARVYLDVRDVDVHGANHPYGFYG